jgi:aryl-alcohol dehydrogenase-like predicted oxidoreductase
MKRASIPNTDLSVSSICYGVMRFGARVHGNDMHELYRVYCEAGGNFFDTAHSYACWYPNGEGCSERSLAECIRKFGNGKDVVISTKGALHDQGKVYPRPDDCMTPAVVGSDITESLQRLQVERIDLYTLHEDDTRHPAGEIIEMLNDEIARGRVRYIGASNWTSARLAEANAYAAAHQLQGFVASSPQWNLGRPNHHPRAWDGTFDSTRHMMTDDDIAWHRKSQVAVMPWTPTGYGYFDGAVGQNPSSFDNPQSQERRERARQLARELGATANQVALAYLMAYDFPVFPIQGTTNMAHLVDSLGADSLRLSPEQRDWLLTGGDHSVLGSQTFAI